VKPGCARQVAIFLFRGNLCDESRRRADRCERARSVRVYERWILDTRRHGRGAVRARAALQLYNDQRGSVPDAGHILIQE